MTRIPAPRPLDGFEDLAADRIIKADKVGRDHLRQVGDLAELGVHPRGEDHRAGRAGDERRASQDDIAAVQQVPRAGGGVADQGD